MSNPFQALLNIQDEDKTSKRSQKKVNAPKLTPAERAKQNEERQKQRQEVVDNSTESFNFVKYDENDNEGFITKDEKKTKTTTTTLTKDQFLQSEDRQKLIDNKTKSSPKPNNKGQGKGNRTGGQGEGGQNRGGNKGGNNQDRGQGQNSPATQNRGTGGNNQNRGNNKGGNKGGNNQNRGGNKGGNNQKEGGEKKGGDPQKKTYVKKDRSKGNPKNAQKRPQAGGSFNWDSNENLVKKDVDTTELVEDVDKVTEVEPEVEDISVEEWVPEEIPEDSDKKVFQPEVKRVGLSAYLAEKKEEEESDAKAKALIEQLTSQKNHRSISVVIPTGSNLNKKEREEDIPSGDSFFFAPKTKSKTTTTKTDNAQSNPSSQIVFKMKRHKGFNMPRERKEGEESGENNRNSRPRDNNQRRNQTGKGGDGRRQNNNRTPKNQFSKNHKDFPPLGGKVAPQKDATWAGRTDDL